MKNLIKIGIVAIYGILSFSSCSEMLQTDSDKILKENQNTLGSANDTVYSILGILSKVQKLADRYVILGELRGDLLDVTDNTDANLREISNLTQVSPSNPYLGVRDYYAVINNCNYFINKVDTSITSQGKKLMLREYALAKTIRAWTYLQLVTTFGTVPFVLDPITTLEDAQKEYPKKNISEIAPFLIADLEPCVDYGLPDYGTLETGWSEIDAAFLCFPIRFVLGDLYLWKGESASDFAAAAYNYATLINENKYLISSSSNRITWTSSSFQYYNNGWTSGVFGSYNAPSNESMTIIPLAMTPTDGTVETLFGLLGFVQKNSSYSYNEDAKQLTPSQRSLTFWENQPYAFSNSTSTVATMTNGDLRKNASIYSNATGTISYIYKTRPYYIPVYRVGLLYLRYAEALNNAGKPGMAFAVLKYGLNPTTFATSGRIPLAELKTGSSYFSMFNNSIYAGNYGIHSRGCGNSILNTSYVIPPTLTSHLDSVNYVDDKILTELALETAFEGNRFPDLARFSIRHNDNSIIANAIALKHTDNMSVIRAFLLDRNNWYLPLPQ